MSVSALGSSALRIGGSLLCGAGLGARVFVVLALAGCLTPGWALAGGIPTLETVVVGGGPEEGLILKTSVADVHCGQNAGRLWVWR